MIHLFLGFFIALAVGLTGVGGGSFTVPALLLIVGLPAGEAVGTAFVFAGVLRLIAAPFYLLGRHVHSRYFRLLLQGAVPGLVLGMYALHSLAGHEGSPWVIILLGLLLAGAIAVAAEYTAVYPFASPGGWNLIGRTAQRLFDAAADPPARFKPGDRLRFVPVP